jgi:hypothetical protein
MSLPPEPPPPASQPSLASPTGLSAPTAQASPPGPSQASGSRPRRTWGLWLALLGLAALLVIPQVIAALSIRPFQPQTAAVLARAYVVRRVAPWLGIVTLGVALTLAGRFWPRLRWFGRGMAVVLLGVIGCAAWVARQEYFEWMFAPQPAAQYARAAAVDFVAPGDPVLGVEIGGEAVAYPIRILAYHHVINDVAGGTPIVATY